MRINSDSLQASEKQIVEGLSSQGELRKLAKHLNPNHTTDGFQSKRRTDEINLKPLCFLVGTINPNAK